MISIRRRAEEAREALSLGLQRVRLIQEQAQSVPQLQSRITRLESELQQYRYKHCGCRGMLVHLFTHHLPLCSADLKFNAVKLQLKLHTSHTQHTTNTTAVMFTKDYLSNPPQ